METNSDNFLQKAEYLTEVERWREAVPLLLKVTAQNPQHFHANCLLSLCHYSLKDYGKALEFAEKSITAEPEAEWGHRLRSLSLTGQSKKKEALKSAEEAVRLAPFESYPLQNLVFAYLNCNKTKKAKEIALKMRENFPENDMTFFALGNVYLQFGNNYEAEKCFREALRLNTNSADARNNLGVALLRQKQTDDTSLFKTSNLSLFQTSDKDEIHQHFTEAVKLEPNNELAAENLRNQFNYFYVLFGFLVFVPFIITVFFVAPAMTILMILIGIFTIIKLLLEMRQRRKQLSPEIKLFLKSSANKGIANQLKRFLNFATEIYRKTWKPHILAIFAVIICYINFAEPAKYSSGSWNQSLAYILVVVSAVWLTSELRKD